MEAALRPLRHLATRKLRLLCAACGIALTGNALATSPLPPALPPVASLVAAENEFAAHSVATDMREAFMRALGADGILLRPLPVPGGAFMSARPAPPIHLNWRPSFAYAAAGGDFGITTGPWQITAKSNPAAPPSHGHFISLWKRMPDGQWRVAFDTGISHPEASGAASFLVIPATVMHRIDSAKAEATLKQFAERVTAEDYAAAVKAFAAPDARVYRDGKPPMVARAEVNALAAEWKGHRLESLAAYGGVAASKDFMWRLHQVRAAGADAKLVSHAFTVWRAKADGDIELWVDVTTDMPPVK